MCASHAEPQMSAYSASARFRQEFLYSPVLLALLVFMAFVFGRSGEAEGPVAETHTLTVEAAAGIDATAVCPPPGKYLFREGDSVILAAPGVRQEGCSPAWSGDVPTSGSVSLTTLDGPKRVVAGSCDGGSGPPPSGNADGFPAPADHCLYAFLRSGNLYGWFATDRTRADQGAGITRLVSAEFPNVAVFNRPNLNFEHIMNGAAADARRSRFTPRTDPMFVRQISPACIEAVWPSETSSWKVDCVLRYTFSGGDAVDVDFEVTPRADEAPMGYLVFMFATYLYSARACAIRFPGVRDGLSGWTRFGDAGECGTVAGASHPSLACEDNDLALNLSAKPGVFFTEPVYYGLMDGDLNPGTADDTMAFIMMFDDPASVRFALWNWGNAPNCGAWDWQYVVREPEVGRTYRHHARMVYCRFRGEDDVLARYRAWRDRPAVPQRDSSAPAAAFPALVAPGGECGFGVPRLVDRIGEMDKGGALAEYGRLFGSSQYAVLAAEGIDRLFENAGDTEGRRAYWESACGGQPDSDIVWYEVGLAREAAGESGRAVTAYEEALRLCPDHQNAKLRLGALTAVSGSVKAGLQLVDEVLGVEPGLAGCAADLCGAAAKKRMGAGDAAGAVELLLTACSLSSGEPRHRAALGEALETVGDNEGALDECRRVLAAVPDSPESRRGCETMDRILMRRNDTAARVAEWRRMVQAHPDASLPQLWLGAALEDAGDASGAEAAYRAALRLRPELQEAKVRLGAAIAAGGDVYGGLPLVDGAVGVMPDLAGFAAEACSRAAKTRLAIHDVPGGLALLKRACSLSPTNLSHRVALGGALESAGDDDGALAEYRAVVMEVPESPRSSVRIDAIHNRRNDTAARVAEWRRMIQMHPDAAVPQLHLGMALTDAGDPSGAETAYRAALRLRPELHEAKVGLGAIVAAGGDVDGGLLLMNDGVGAMPDLAGFAAEACSRAASARLAVHDIPGGLSLLKRARSLSPTNLSHRVALGGALEAAGDDDGALAEYRAVVMEVPESPRSSARIDAIYGRRNDSAARVAEWRHLADLHPGAAWPRVHLGLALESGDNQEGAETAYREALSRNALLDIDSALFRRVRDAEKGRP